MKKGKLSLSELKVDSFLTDVKKIEIETVKGGRTTPGCPVSLDSV